MKTCPIRFDGIECGREIPASDEICAECCRGIELLLTGKLPAPAESPAHAIREATDEERG